MTKNQELSLAGQLQEIYARLRELEKAVIALNKSMKKVAAWAQAQEDEEVDKLIKRTGESALKTLSEMHDSTDLTKKIFLQSGMTEEEYERRAGKKDGV